MVTASDVNIAKSYATAGRFIPHPIETVITNFPSGHGYSKQSAAGTQSDDTVDYVRGSQSLKLVTDGDSAAVFTRKSSISPTLDFSGDYIKLLVKADDISIAQELWVYLSSDNFVSDFYTFKFSDDGNQFEDGEWAVLTMSFGDALSSGSPNRAAINAIQVRCRDDNSGALTVNFGGLSTFSEASAGICSITFDDGWASTYSEGRKKMDDYNFAGTAYVIPSKIDTGGYMTKAQLTILQDMHGWDISGHHITDLTSIDNVEFTVKDVKNWLLKNSYIKGANHFAYPGGQWNTTVVDVVKKYFLTGRITANIAETIPPGDRMRLRIMMVLNTTTTGAIQTAVTQALNNKEWLILVFHKIVTTPGVSTEYSIVNFGTVIDDIDSQGIAVRTVSDVFTTQGS